MNRELGRSPEDDPLLQVQGMMAAYERAKIIERHRRGKLHAARAGAVNVLSGAPYGYRYVPKYEGCGQAHYAMSPDEARVVRQVFAWISGDRLTIPDRSCVTEAGNRRTPGRGAPRHDSQPDQPSSLTGSAYCRGRRSTGSRRWDNTRQQRLTSEVIATFDMSGGQRWHGDGEDAQACLAVGCPPGGGGCSAHNLPATNCFGHEDALPFFASA